MQDGLAILAQFDDFGNLWFVVALLVIAAARAIGEKLKDKPEEPEHKRIPPIEPERGQPRSPKPAQRHPSPPPPGRPRPGPVIVALPDEEVRPLIAELTPLPRARPVRRKRAHPQAEVPEPMLAELQPLKHAKSQADHPPDQPIPDAKPARRKFGVNRKVMRKAIILSEILRPPLALRDNGS